ncbi:MAG: hypothetical protein R8K22_00445 [Mariprofundaceae bacterium]
MLSTDLYIVINILLAIGIIQLMWLSVMLFRRGIVPSTIWQSILPLISLWVLIWPVYEEPQYLWIGIIILGLPILPTYVSKRAFWSHLRRAWSSPTPADSSPHMWPLISLLMALTFTITLFQHTPEFGLGIALSLTLAFPFATLLDRMQKLKLGFPLHPKQTLFGHLGFIIAIALLCGWSINLYHGLPWQQLFIATTLAGMSASLIRAITPQTLHLPLAATAMTTTLWLL